MTRLHANYWREGEEEGTYETETVPISA